MTEEKPATDQIASRIDMTDKSVSPPGRDAPAPVAVNILSQVAHKALNPEGIVRVGGKKFVTDREFDPDVWYHVGTIEYADAPTLYAYVRDPDGQEEWLRVPSPPEDPKIRFWAESDAINLRKELEFDPKELTMEDQ
ncbi:hypothetical protein [Haloglomus salinum]|uniref:hypothetical protein n=1 Tax=Haloglomus salinum TaxID=2962673 RepID=UPI0020C93C03|nr:hypothetical protein [Haloglomus salinum]